ncbi:MAG: TonB-dependent receptor [Cephaloticoccus sp.]|nr:TonB-dependent receptor [Cephaloticoccus sp.]MCF7759343.1 TonB-dependent receptor [Cephaloticoccus sp.]
MKPDSTLLAGVSRQCRSALWICLALFALSLNAAPAETVRSFNVPAGEAGQTLKQFAEQAKCEIVFLPAAVKGLQTNAVSGELTPRAALDQMLAATGLVVSEDEKTGAFAIKAKAERPSEKNAERAAQISDRPAKAILTDGDLVTLEEYAVTGSRLTLNAGEQPVQPVLTYTALDIERTGASDLGQLLQYIPSLTSYSTGIATETLNGSVISGMVAQTNGRTTAQLRGGDQTSTLLLVDGKRVANTAIRNVGGNGYDLGGIPLSAIDRVEVLLDGASAIYGADAIHGVINVILKKRYSGTELRFSYDNTFDKDAGIKTVSLSHGFSTGKLSGLVTLSASDSNLMLLADRRILATYDRRTLGGTSDGSGSTSAFYNGAGSVNRASGILPGLTSLRASIPTNSNGQNLTVTDYANAPVPVGGNIPDIASATTAVKRKSGYARLAYDVEPWLQVATMVRYGENRSTDNGRYRIMENVTIPVGYPGNVFGVPIRLQKNFTDLPPVYSIVESINSEYALSFTGKLPGDWRYEASVNFLRGENNQIPTRTADGSVINYAVTASTMTQKVAAAQAAGNPPILIYDSRSQSPNAPGALDQFWVNPNPTVLRDLNEIWTYAGQVEGKLFNLPAGEVRSVLGFEYREDTVSFPAALGGSLWPSIPERKITSFFMEARIPLFSAKKSLPLLQQLDLNFALRTEDYNDVGGATTPRYGVAWRPIKSLLVRGSYGEGFLVPQLYRTAGPTSATTVPWSIFASSGADPGRGNTVNPGTVTVIGGGNPGLDPQKSEHATYGIVVDVPKVEGLSFSFDLFDNNYTDGFGSLSTLADRVNYKPETVTRGPNLPTDQPGWLGPVTAYDGRTINIAKARTAGYNFGLRWFKKTGWGDLTFNSSGERIVRDEQQIVPNGPYTATINKRYRPMRVTTSLFWSHNAWDAGVTNMFGGEYWVDTSNATLAPSRYTDSVMRWDFNASYDFGRRPGFGSKGSAWWQRALGDSKLRVTIINAFDTEPPLDVRGYFSSAVIDPRLRRYVIDVTKRF